MIDTLSLNLILIVLIYEFCRCYEKKKCVETRPDQQANFCCCNGELCNQEVEYRPTTEITPSQSPPKGGIMTRRSSQQLTNTILCSIVPIIGLSNCLIFIFYKKSLKICICIDSDCTTYQRHRNLVKFRFASSLKFF